MNKKNQKMLLWTAAGAGAWYLLSRGVIKGDEVAATEVVLDPTASGEYRSLSNYVAVKDYVGVSGR